MQPMQGTRSVYMAKRAAQARHGTGTAKNDTMQHGGAVVPCHLVPPCRYSGPSMTLRTLSCVVPMGTAGHSGRGRATAVASEVAVGEAGGVQPQARSPEATAAGEVAGAPPRPRSRERRPGRGLSPLDLGRATEEPSRPRRGGEWREGSWPPDACLGGWRNS